MAAVDRLPAADRNTEMAVITPEPPLSDAEVLAAVRDWVNDRYNPVLETPDGMKAVGQFTFRYLDALPNGEMPKGIQAKQRIARRALARFEDGHKPRWFG